MSLVSRLAAVLFVVLFVLKIQNSFGRNHLPSNVTEIILGYGYPVENHHAQTSDGWILSLQRIPHGKNNTVATKGVVFFQHGLTDCSVGICLNFPIESLAFTLADEGYDVWLGNNRGNGYSMTNIHYTSKDDGFWDFSYDEMATYDIPTQVDYVLQYTQSSKLSYIGHSEGTIQLFALLSEDPSFSEKLNIFVALAPVAYVAHVESLILQALAKLDTVAIYELLGIHEFDIPSVIDKVLPGVCTIDPEGCQFVIDLLCGPTTYLNDTRIPYYNHYEPNPTSVKNMAHWAQGVKTGTFQKYDYGREGNLKNYNQTTPPPYNLANFPTDMPLALFCGGEDYLADPKDVQTLLTVLPSPPFVHYEATYAHLDPLIGVRAYIDIYPIVLTLLEQYSR